MKNEPKNLKEKETKDEKMEMLDVVSKALQKNVSGGVDTCGDDAGRGGWHDTCYDGQCHSDDDFGCDYGCGDDPFST